MALVQKGFGERLEQALFPKEDTDTNLVSNLLAKQQEGESASSPPPF